VVPPGAERGFIRESLRVEPTFAWEGQDGHFGCLDEMFAALREERKPETDCTDNVKSMVMVFGALESAKQGKRVLLAGL
jgi:hypothetical protein